MTSNMSKAVVAGLRATGTGSGGGGICSVSGDLLMANRPIGAVLPATPSAAAADVDQLHAAVFCRFRRGGLEQLLFAKPDRFDARWADAEWIDQRFADRVGALLAELEIVFAVSFGVGVSHDQEAIALQI